MRHPALFFSAIAVLRSRPVGAPLRGSFVVSHFYFKSWAGLCVFLVAIQVRVPTLRARMAVVIRTEYPASLNAKTHLIVCEAVAKFSVQTDVAELCKYVITKLRPLFRKAILDETLRQHMALSEMGDLLWPSDDIYNMGPGFRHFVRYERQCAQLLSHGSIARLRLRHLGSADVGGRGHTVRSACVGTRGLDATTGWWLRPLRTRLSSCAMTDTNKGRREAIGG